MHTLDPAIPDACSTSAHKISADRQKNLLSSYPVLTEIDNPEWVKIINRAKSIEVSSHTVLFSSTAPSNSFMLILKGIIRIYQAAADGREMTLYRVAAGELCILSLNSMLHNRTFNAIAETDTDVSALVFSADDFHHLMGISEIFRNYVVSTLTERFCETLSTMQNMAFNHLNMRLACMLGSLFERNQGTVLKITHQNLAHELGTTREVISRILKEFEHQNCIKLSRGHIELTSTESLEWFSTNKK